MSEDIAATPIIRILKIGTCQNLSGKSELGYHIGHSPDSAICFRVVSNSGGGFFSAEWVSLLAIQKAIEEAPKPITSYALARLFPGKSVNTPGYLHAILLAEGLVQRDTENPRVYVSCSPDAFLAEMQSLIDAGTSLDVPPINSGKRKPVEVIPVLKATADRPKKSKSKAA